MSNENQPTAVYTGYKHRCVVDTQGNYVEFVQVHIYTAPDGSIEDRVQHYAIQDGEYLVEVNPPSYCPYAGAGGFILPQWNKALQKWVEGATLEEIAIWAAEHPAPATTQAVPTAEEQLRADVDFLAAIQGVEL